MTQATEILLPWAEFHRQTHSPRRPTSHSGNPGNFQAWCRTSGTHLGLQKRPFTGSAEFWAWAALGLLWALGGCLLKWEIGAIVTIKRIHSSCSQPNSWVPCRYWALSGTVGYSCDQGGHDPCPRAADILVSVKLCWQWTVTWSVNWFADASRKKYQKTGGLKPWKFVLTVLESRIKVSKIKLAAGLGSLHGLQGRTLPCQCLLVILGVPWLVDPWFLGGKLASPQFLPTSLHSLALCVPYVCTCVQISLLLEEHQSLDLGSTLTQYNLLTWFYLKDSISKEDHISWFQIKMDFGETLFNPV